MGQKKRQLGGLFLALWLGLGALYFFVFRAWAELYFLGQAPAWFSVMAESAYPRLATEAQRLPASFFLGKLDSVFWRSGLLFFAVFAVLFPGRQLKRFFSRSTEKASSLFYVRMYALGTLLLTWPWWEYWQVGEALAAFYSPSWPWRSLSENYPSEALRLLLYVPLMLSAVFALFLSHKKLFWALVIHALSFFLGVSLLYSFGKVDHTYAPWMLVSFTVPWLVRYPKSSWPLWCLRSAVVFPYFLAGIEKLLQSGLSWAALHELFFFSGQSATANAVLSGLFLLAFFGQLLSPLVLFFSRTRIFFGLLGLGFHWGVYFFLGIGGIFHPWVLGYLFFFSPSVIKKTPLKRFKQRFRKKMPFVSKKNG